VPTKPNQPPLFICDERHAVKSRCIKEPGERGQTLVFILAPFFRSHRERRGS
jgi:hypothetical protein